MYSTVGSEINLTNNWLNAVKNKSNKNVFPLQWTMRHFFQLWRHISLQWKMWYFFSVMETDYSTPLINVCSETSTPKNVFPLQWKMWYFFSFIETNYSTPLITVCSEASIQKKYYHVSEQCGTFFQLWRQIPLQWTMWYFFSVM